MSIPNLMANLIPMCSKKILGWFKSIARLALILVLAKLVKNWQAECAKFQDNIDLKLNLNIYIRYKNATLNKRIEISERKIIILRETQSIIDTSRYLIITLPTSHKNNVLYYLSIHKSGFIILLGKKRQEFYTKLTAQDVQG